MANKVKLFLNPGECDLPSWLTILIKKPRKWTSSNRTVWQHRSILVTRSVASALVGLFGVVNNDTALTTLSYRLAPWLMIVTTWTSKEFDGQFWCHQLVVRWSSLVKIFGHQSFGEHFLHLEIAYLTGLNGARNAQTFQSFKLEKNEISKLN